MRLLWWRFFWPGVREVQVDAPQGTVADLPLENGYRVVLDHAPVCHRNLVGLHQAVADTGPVHLDSQEVGLLAQGNGRLKLRLPDGVRGTVDGSPDGTRRSLPVEWGQTMFRLAPAAAAGEETAESSAGGSRTGAKVFKAPTDGVYYTRPGPGSEPFVRAGDTLERGQPVGLIEVMKTFNQVLFEDASLPDPAVIEEVLVEDGAEVRAGDPLFRVR